MYRNNVQPWSLSRMPIETNGNHAVHRYLDRMHVKREGIFALLDGLDEKVIWQRPEPGEWSIGETVDHLRVIYWSMLPLFKVTWVALKPWARVRREKPYMSEIDNVYHRPSFPMNVGWLWPPRYTPERPTALVELQHGLEAAHNKVDAFFREKDQDLLGHIPLYDPAIGRLNLVQALKVGIDHDELHYEEIDRIIEILG